MTGRQLYDRYSFEQAQLGVEVDEWEDIEESERAAWVALARYVNAWHEEQNQEDQR